MLQLKENWLRASLENAKAITFQQCAEEYVAQNKAGWKNEKHTEQWGNTLAAYAYPHFGSLPVQAVDTPLVQRALRLIWTEKHNRDRAKGSRRQDDGLHRRCHCLDAALRRDWKP